MPRLEYTPKDALALLLRLLEPKSADLTQRIRVAIDAGKDVQVEEPVSGGRGRQPRKRYYRKNEPYTDQEALDVAMTVLNSHLIEIRMLVNAAHAEFKRVGLAPPKPLKTMTAGEAQSPETLVLEMETTEEVANVIAKDEYKAIEIEAEPETVQEKKNLPDIRFEPVSEQELTRLCEVFAKLRDLVDFEENHSANAH